MNTYDSKFLISDGYSSLPTSRSSVNEACRALYYTHPIINSIINSHSEIPINYLKIDLPENNSSKFYEDLINTIHLKNFIYEIIREFWLVGEAFVYAELNESTGSWSKLFMQNPDYIIVKRTAIEDDCSYFLRPDENLRRLVLSSKSEDKEKLKKLNQSIIKFIKNGENIPLDNFYLSHIVRKISPYEVRGTGLLNPILKLAINDSNADSETIRICLMDPFINNKINIEKLKFSYTKLFSIIEQWAAKKIFLPIAKINSFYEYKDGDKLPCIPDLKFDIEGLIKALKE
jgi:hypothetical protein